MTKQQCINDKNYNLGIKLVKPLFKNNKFYYDCVCTFFLLKENDTFVEKKAEVLPYRELLFYYNSVAV